MVNKPTLASAVREQYKKLHVNSLKLHDQLGVSDEAMNRWLRSNKFSKELLPKFMRLVGLPEDIQELQRSYRFSFCGVRSAIRATDLQNILPLVKAIAESGCETVTVADFNVLLEVQQTIGTTLSPIMVQEIVRARR